MAKTPPKLLEKLHALEFDITTSLAPPLIAEACARSAELAKQTMSFKMQMGGVYEDGCEIELKPWLVGRAVGLVEVAWQPDGDQRWRVCLQAVQWTVSRPTMNGIPAGPKSISGLKSMQRFSESLQVELQAVGLPFAGGPTAPAPVESLHAPAATHWETAQLPGPQQPLPAPPQVPVVWPPQPLPAPPPAGDAWQPEPLPAPAPAAMVWPPQPVPAPPQPPVGWQPQPSTERLVVELDDEP